MIARHSAPARRVLRFVPDRGPVCSIPGALVPEPVCSCCLLPDTAHIDARPSPRKAGLNPDGIEVHYHESWALPLYPAKNHQEPRAR